MINSFQRICEFQEVVGSQAALNPVTLLLALALIQSGISVHAVETHHVDLLKAKPQPRQCENVFQVWSHIILFSYTLILKHITLLPSKWTCMISLLILILSFLLIRRRRLENCAV